MRTLLALSTLALVSCSCSQPRQGYSFSNQPHPADASSLRTVRTGALVGFADGENTHAWLGIPFAAPPVGELRWKAPRPPVPWAGTREAVRFGDACVQFANPTVVKQDEVKEGEAFGSEDCLFLNVWAPRFAPDAVPSEGNRLPVMVWIHGGGNSVGTAAPYSMKNLAGRHQLVVVTVNYRLGLFGWFRHPALHGPDATAEDRSGNYGTLDLIAALEWVRDNVAAFGGDPGNVTVFGESAGAMNVTALLVSPRARGLFHRAISQSGAPTSVSVATAENLVDAPQPGSDASARERVALYLQADGRAKDRAGAIAAADAMPEQELADYLRAKPAAELLAVAKPWAFGMYRGTYNIRDGAVLPEAPFPDVLADPSRFNAVPVILGTNRDEYKLFMALNPNFVNVWFGKIPRVRDQAEYDRTAAYVSQGWKAVGVDLPATRMTQGGHAPVYAYRMDWDEGPDRVVVDLAKVIGAAHAVEIPFVHDDPASDPVGLHTEKNAASREALAHAMSSYWAEFARTGNPGNGGVQGLPAWAPWNPAPGAPKYLVFDTPNDGGIRMASETITLGDLAEKLAADAAYEGRAEQRCRTYALTMSIFGRDSGQWTPDEYGRWAKGVCQAYPLTPAR